MGHWKSVRMPKVSPDEKTKKQIFEDYIEDEIEDAMQMDLNAFIDHLDTQIHNVVFKLRASQRARDGKHHKKPISNDSIVKHAAGWFKPYVLELLEDKVSSEDYKRITTAKAVAAKPIPAIAREKKPRKRWSTEETKIVRQLIRAGKTPKQYRGKKLAGRTQSAFRSKFQREKHKPKHTR